METLPQHLQKYIVKQDYSKYTPVDQASWRFILRQLRDFLSTHAHPSYLEGLEKTGISTDRIPSIDEISKKLEKFGWRALPVSGFIPPAAFMELQSLSVLPIAADMRSLGHLMYTPAPDIVHEAAGHAPILVDPKFAAYLKQYAQVAKKAIVSREDLELYKAIRDLSDIKESPDSTEADVNRAQKHLEKVSSQMSHTSEAALLSRMNWWTAEYGLIGSLDNPKIFGAGLLSSVGESRWCLSQKVKKLPLTINCIKYSYDITEPQPQLFVTPDFETLGLVLNQLADQMAFRQGGWLGIEKAIAAETTNTAELNSGLQISGKFIEAIKDKQGKLAYLKAAGPVQLCYKYKELAGQGTKQHPQGFGTALGLPMGAQNCLSSFNDEELRKINLQEGKTASLKMASGVLIEGKLKSIQRQEGKIVLLSFADCKVTFQNQLLFDPSWGQYDMAVGSEILSVFGGPADRVSFGETEDFQAQRVPQHIFSAQEKLFHQQYQKIRQLREQQQTPKLAEICHILETQKKNFPQDWLLALEAFELLYSYFPKEKITANLEKELLEISHQQEMIKDGVRLAKVRLTHPHAASH